MSVSASIAGSRVPAPWVAFSWLWGETGPAAAAAGRNGNDRSLPAPALAAPRLPVGPRAEGDGVPRYSGVGPD